MSVSHLGIVNNGQDVYANTITANTINCYVMDIGQLNAPILSDVLSISGNGTSNIDFKASNNTTKLLSISQTPSTILSANSAINFMASDGSTPLVSISGNSLTKCNLIKASATDLKIQDSTGSTMAEINNGKLTVPQFQLTTAPTAGYILKSDASGNASWMPDSVTPVGSIIGTANQINVSVAGDEWTLSTPQDIATTSNVEFAELKTTGNINCGGDMNIAGSLNSVTANTVSSGDNSFEFLDANTTDLLDFGIFGKRITTGQTYYDGFFRNHSTNRFQLYKNYQGSVATNWISPTLGDLDVADLALLTWSIGGSAVNSTAADLNKVYNITNGTASANKALIFDVNRSISNINSLTATSLTGSLTSGVQSGITGIGTQSQALDMNTHAISNVTTLGATTINATTLNGTVGTAAQPNITSLGAQAADLDMNTHGITDCNLLTMTGPINMQKNAMNDVLQINTDTSGDNTNKAGLQLSKTASYGSGDPFTDVGQTMSLNSSCTTGMTQITTQITAPLGTTSTGTNNKISLQVEQPTGGATNTALYVNGTTKVNGAIDLNSQNITNGGTITSSSFVGALTGNASTATTAGSATTAATVTSATQSSITTLPNISSLNGVSVGSTQWNYLTSITPGITSASKALVVDGSKNLVGLGAVGIASLAMGGNITMADNNVSGATLVETIGVKLRDGVTAANWLISSGNYNTNFGKLDSDGTLRSDIFTVGNSSGNNYANTSTILKSTVPIHYLLDTTQSQTAGWSSRFVSGGYTAIESINKPIGLFTYDSAGANQKMVFSSDVSGNCTALTSLATPALTINGINMPANQYAIFTATSGNQSIANNPSGGVSVNWLATTTNTISGLTPTVGSGRSAGQFNLMKNTSGSTQVWEVMFSVRFSSSTSGYQINAWIDVESTDSDSTAFQNNCVGQSLFNTTGTAGAISTSGIISVPNNSFVKCFLWQNGNSTTFSRGTGLDGSYLQIRLVA